MLGFLVSALAASEARAGKRLLKAEDVFLPDQVTEAIKLGLCEGDKR